MLLVLFWLCWFGMIVWSVLIVVYAPKCKKEPDQAWFTKGSVAKFNCAVPLEDIAVSTIPFRTANRLTLYYFDFC